MSEKETSALDNMNELYEWLTAWGKHVQGNTRTRSNDNGTTEEEKPRKRVHVKRRNTTI